MSFQTPPSAHDTRALNYLQERYSLTLADIFAHRDSLRILLGCNGSFDAFDQHWRENEALSNQSIVNAFRNCGFDVEAVMDTPEFAERVGTLRQKLLGTVFEGVETFIEGFYPFEKGEEKMAPITKGIREEAVAEMNELYGREFEMWPEFKHGLSDEEMERYFFARVDANPSFLSTYFDSARFGLVNKELALIVDKVAYKAQRNWPAFLRRMKQRVIRALENGSTPEADRHFIAENCTFHENGSQAFARFREAAMQGGTSVLATHEEYSKIIEEMNKHDICVSMLKGPEDEKDFLELLEKDLKDKPSYLLISEVGRLGNVYPLGKVNEIRKRVSPDTKIVVDAVQCAGRWQHDMRACEADAVILSTQKGSDLGQGMGVLALSQNMNHLNVDEADSSRPHEAIAHTGFAMNPDGLPKEASALFQVLSPVQRKEAVQQITKTFLKFIQVIKEDGSANIEILSPVTDEVAHVVELKVPGAKREKIAGWARSFGVYIHDDYEDPRDDEAVRIAFHPFMTHDSLKLLAYALLSVEHADQDA